MANEPKTYDVPTQHVVMGVTIPQGAYKGFATKQKSMFVSGGFYTRHLMKVPGVADDVDVTALVEKQAIIVT